MLRATWQIPLRVSSPDVRGALSWGFKLRCDRESPFNGDADQARSWEDSSRLALQRVHAEDAARQDAVEVARGTHQQDLQEAQLQAQHVSQSLEMVQAYFDRRHERFQAEQRSDAELAQQSRDALEEQAIQAIHQRDYELTNIESDRAQLAGVKAQNKHLQA